MARGGDGAFSWDPLPRADGLGRAPRVSGDRVSISKWAVGHLMAVACLREGSTSPRDSADFGPDGGCCHHVALEAVFQAALLP